MRSHVAAGAQNLIAQNLSLLWSPARHKTSKPTTIDSHLALVLPARNPWYFRICRPVASRRMPSYVQLKSPFMSPPSAETNLAQGLDRKAEYIDKDGVLRRSNSVTRRMIQRGVSIKLAGDLKPNEQLHTSIGDRVLEKQTSRRATVQLGEEAEQKQAANAALKYQAKFDKEKWLKEVNQRAAERVTCRLEQQQQAVLALESLIDVTENNTAMSPSRTNTYVDSEGNLRRRISATPEECQQVHDDFVTAPATPPPPAPTKVDEPHEYC